LLISSIEACAVPIVVLEFRLGKSQMDLELQPSHAETNETNKIMDGVQKNVAHREPT
jgi:hypothetical protein